MKNIKLFVLLLVLVSFAAVANAATYGYVVLRGKNAEQMEREVETLTRLIKTWKNGEVLYTHTVKSGIAFFFKKITSTVFFAGDQKNISSLLTSGPYEGDYLKNIVVKFNFTSNSEENNYSTEINTTYTKQFPNIRKAVEEIKDKDVNTMWRSFGENRVRDYRRHMGKTGKAYNKSASVVFYTIQPIEENRLFGITFEEDNDVVNTRMK